MCLGLTSEEHRGGEACEGPRGRGCEGFACICPSHDSCFEGPAAAPRVPREGGPIADTALTGP